MGSGISPVERTRSKKKTTGGSSPEAATTGGATAGKLNYTLQDVINDPNSRKILDSIEEAADEIRDRGIDPNDTTEFWVRAYQADVQELRNKYGYDYDSNVGSTGSTGSSSGFGRITSKPSDITSSVRLTPRSVLTHAQNSGLDFVRDSEIASIPVGTQVVFSSPIMRSRMSSRRDPDGVKFTTGTFAGLSSGAFKRPIVVDANGNRHSIETDMPYESIYVKRRP